MRTSYITGGTFWKLAAVTALAGAALYSMRLVQMPASVIIPAAPGDAHMTASRLEPEASASASPPGNRDSATAGGGRQSATGVEDPDLPVRLLNCGKPEIETGIMRLLIQRGDSRSVTLALGKMLSLDTTSGSAPEYMAVFAECKDPSVARWLVRAMSPANNEILRRRAALLLDTMRGPETVFFLSLSIEAPDPYADPSSEAMKLIAGRKDASEVRALIDIFNSTQNIPLKESIAVALAGIGTPEAGAFLIQTAIGDSADSGIALAAIPLITSSYAQETLLNTAQDRDIPEPAKIAVISALASHQSQRVYTVLSNLDISQASQDLQRTIDTAIAGSKPVAEPVPSAQSAMNRDHETCF